MKEIYKTFGLYGCFRLGWGGKSLIVSKIFIFPRECQKTSPPYALNFYVKVT